MKGAQMLQRTHTTAKKPAAATKPVTKLVPPPDPIEAILLTTYQVSDADLETLAANRAKAAQNYLIDTGKVEAARIFLKAGGVQTLRRDGSRAYLQFQ